MKIYFTASLTGRKMYLQNYKRIVEELKKFSKDVIYEHILYNDPQKRFKETTEERKEIFRKVENWIKSCDIMVAEISFPSTNVGYEISKAVDEDKPVLALCVEGKMPALLIGAKTDKLRVINYKLPNLSEIIVENIEDLKEQMNTRFNFFIQPVIGHYLNWIAKKRKTPRAVFLRDLIKKAMREDREYQREK
jgi:nucleoside 2-deoxyribosyltransferase